MRLELEALGVEVSHPAHLAVLHHQFGGKSVGLQLDGRNRPGLGHQRPQNFAAGGISVGVKNARAAVGAFARERQLGAVAVKAHAPVDELMDLLRPFLHQHAHGFFAAKPVAGQQRVVQVKRDLVVFAERRGNASLGVLGAGFIQIVLGEHKNAAAPRQLNRRPHPGNSPAENDKIHSAVLVRHHE